jgi:hypothetical protein
MATATEILSGIGLNETKWSYPLDELPQIVYELTTYRLNSSIRRTQEGDLLFQYTHKTKLRRVQILNVRADALQQTLDSWGYWEGKPSVTQVFPDSDIGYFNVSGTVVETM